MTKKNECSCWVRHAVDPVHRKQVTDDLAYFRRIGDSTGALLAMAQLGSCPSVQTSAE